MRDETRERFEKQKFPNYVKPFYLGRMHNKSSLGRYLLGVTTPESPIKIKKVEARLLSFSDLDAGNLIADGDHPCSVEIQTEFEFKEPIAAYHMNYSFYNIWGQEAAGEGYTRIVDVDKQESISLLDNLVYDLGTSIENERPNSMLFAGLVPSNFHVCILGLSHVRTQDSGAHIMPMEHFNSILKWALPVNE